MDCSNCTIPSEASFVKTPTVNLRCGHTVYGLRPLGDQVVCPFCNRLACVVKASQRHFDGCIVDSGYLYCKRGEKRNDMAF